MGRPIGTHGLREVGCGAAQAFLDAAWPTRSCSQEQRMVGPASSYFLTGMVIFETVIVSPVISPVNSTV
jgi:hypothetical protein